MPMADKLGHLEVIDIPKIADSLKDEWVNVDLSEVDDSKVRLGVVRGEFHWHKHDREDEFFLVLEGRLTIELEGRSVVLLPKQGFTVPKGVRHRPRADERTVILMIEKNTVDPKGD